MKVKRRTCRSCGCELESDEAGACQDCRGVDANIKGAHAVRQTLEEAADPARYEELLRKRVGS